MKSLTSGTTCTDHVIVEKLLKNVQDITRLIKACKENGIKDIEVEGLKLSFHETGKVSKWDEPFHESTKETVVSERTSGKALAVAEAEARKTLKSAQDDQAQELLLNDPLAYENALLQGELEDDRGQEASDSGFEPHI